MAEAGDLVCWAEGRPLFALPASVSPDRGVALVADVETNFRNIELRK
jgi:hypothetical protein